MKLVRLEGKNFNVIHNGKIIADVKHVSTYGGSYEIKTIHSDSIAWALRQKDIILWTKRILDKENIAY